MHKMINLTNLNESQIFKKFKNITKYKNKSIRNAKIFTKFAKMTNIKKFLEYHYEMF